MVYWDIQLKIVKNMSLSSTMHLKPPVCDYYHHRPYLAFIGSFMVTWGCPKRIGIIFKIPITKMASIISLVVWQLVCW